MFSFWINSLQRDKILFLCFVAFIAGQIIFTIKGIETFPFWNYGMYSAKLSELKQIEVNKLLINDKEYDLNSVHFSKVFVEYQLSHAKKSDRFGLWLKKYLESHDKITVEKASLLIQTFEAEKPYKLIRSDEYQIY